MKSKWSLVFSPASRREQAKICKPKSRINHSNISNCFEKSDDESSIFFIFSLFSICKEPKKELHGPIFIHFDVFLCLILNFFFLGNKLSWILLSKNSCLRARLRRRWKRICPLESNTIIFTVLSFLGQVGFNVFDKDKEYSSN